MRCNVRLKMLGGGTSAISGGYYLNWNGRTFVMLVIFLAVSVAGYQYVL